MTSSAGGLEQAARARSAQSVGVRRDDAIGMARLCAGSYHEARGQGGCVLASRRPQLGDLERAVLDRLWSAGPAGVRAVHEAVGAARSISAQTVHSALERLVRKGLAERRKVGRAYEYRARVSRREWMAQGLDGLASELPGAGAGVLLAAFVDLAERAGEERLAELERLVRSRRRRKRGMPD
jgi:predicted transcriptional regulator